MDRTDLPLGFAFMLAQNPDAMKRFSDLPESKQTQILKRAHGVSSKGEMRALVKELSVMG